MGQHSAVPLASMKGQSPWRTGKLMAASATYASRNYYKKLLAFQNIASLHICDTG